MKISQIYILILSLFFFNLSAQNTINDTINTESLIGHWKFLKIEDQHGKQVKKIEKDAPKGLPGSKNGKIQIKANGPDIMLNQDSTYKKVFPGENNIDSGKWILTEGIIEYIQIYEKGGKDYQMLKFAADAFDKKLEFDKNENIIERFSEKILFFNDKRMKLKYEDIYLIVYEKF